MLNSMTEFIHRANDWNVMQPGFLEIKTTKAPCGAFVVSIQPHTRCGLIHLLTLTLYGGVK